MVFRVEKVDVFFILGIFIRRDFVVNFLGSLYIYEMDGCVCLEFFKGCVEKLEIFRVMVWL